MTESLTLSFAFTAALDNPYVLRWSNADGRPRFMSSFSTVVIGERRGDMDGSKTPQGGVLAYAGPFAILSAERQS